MRARRSADHSKKLGTFDLELGRRCEQLDHLLVLNSEAAIFRVRRKPSSRQIEVDLLLFQPGQPLPGRHVHVGTLGEHQIAGEATKMTELHSRLRQVLRIAPSPLR